MWTDIELSPTIHTVNEKNTTKKCFSKFVNKCLKLWQMLAYAEIKELILVFQNVTKALYLTASGKAAQ